jgi:hypothetical protein
MASQNSKTYWNKMTLFANLQETNKIIAKERTSNYRNYNTSWKWSLIYIKKLTLFLLVYLTFWGEF